MDKTIDSVTGVGRYGPDSNKNIYLPNGCVVPVGEVIENQYSKEEEKELKNKWGHWNGLNYNEYVVYNTAQVLIRYVIEIKETIPHDY